MRGLGEARSAFFRTRLQRVTGTLQNLRDLKPAPIVDAPEVTAGLLFDRAFIAISVLFRRLLDVRDRKPRGNDGIASSDRVPS